jgi:hypothetical protein
MHLQTGRRLSPAFVVAMIALFVALGGTAGAVVTAAVPLAKRALVADKAKVANTAKVATTAKIANTAKLATTAKTAMTATTATRATTAALADNANALGGSTSAQIIAAATTAGRDAALAQSPAGPRPASTAAGMVLIKTDTTQQSPASSGRECSPGATRRAERFSHTTRSRRAGRRGRSTS